MIRGMADASTLPATDIPNALVGVLLVSFVAALLVMSLWDAVAPRLRNAGSPGGRVRRRPAPPSWLGATVLQPDDVIPAVIHVSDGCAVFLEHNPDAHGGGPATHWRLRVDSCVAGSAARRDGVALLLRALEGTTTVYFDARGSGPGRYRLVDLLAVFEHGRLPMASPCPESRS
jgi:hypothetical protein